MRLLTSKQKQRVKDRMERKLQHAVDFVLNAQEISFEYGDDASFARTLQTTIDTLICLQSEAQSEAQRRG